MPWNMPISMLAQNVTEFTVTVTGDDLRAYDLFDETGQPSGTVDVTVNISGRVGTIIIPVDFAAGSTFAINITGGGFVLGGGGDGGRGGFGFGGNGVAGDDGGPAIQSAHDFSLNADSGFVLGGGGGGGGGGAGTFSGTEPFGGGGGGGGQGYDSSSGGGGEQGGTGEAGSVNGPGDGGDAVSGIGGDGGDGGLLGESGDTGSPGTGSPNGSGGVGGDGGKAIIALLNPITVTLTGSKSQATLVSEDRFISGTTDVTVTDP